MKWGFWLKRLKPKTTSLHARLHKTEFRVRGRYMICLVWICLNLVYQLECLITIWKWKGKHGSFLVSHSKMKLLGGFWNFHIWNPKPLLFMLDYIRQSLGLGGRYMIFLVWICLDPCLSTLMLTIWHKKTMCFGFSFFWFFWNFDAHLNLGQILGLTKI